MTKQVNNSLPRILKTGLVGVGLAAARQLPQAGSGSGDSLTLQSSGRSLKQVPAATPASPPPPATPAAPAGYYDILFGAPVCAAVVPDWNHYGACSEGVQPTLDRVTLLAAQGCKVFNLDLFETNVKDTAAYNATTMGYVQAVADHAASLGMNMLVGPSKDDVTMSNRVPTSDTSGLLVALANQFSGALNVGLNVGGLPHNEDGSQTPAIAQTYGNISSAVRATGYKGLLTFTAPERDGRTGLNHFVPTANRIQDPNMRFVVYPYSGGNTTEALSWMQPCAGTLPCAVVTGPQVNATLGINNNINQVTSELNFTRANNIPTFITPWDSSAIESAQGEQVLLNGDTCVNPNATISVSSAGQSILNLQKGITG